MLKNLMYLGTLTLSLGAVACGGSDPISLQSEGLPIVAMRCGGCHARSDGVAEAIANGVFLEQKSDVLGLVGSFIVAGDSTNSGFVKIMRQEMAVGVGPTLMPPPMSGVAAVPASEVDVIAQWVDEGALDN